MDGELKKPLADEVLDELLPDSMDWREKVVSYPLTAMVLSGLGGFVLGRRHGTAILEALADFASNEVDRNISHFLGENRGQQRE